jgi:hypothetical protein
MNALTGERAFACMCLPPGNTTSREVNSATNLQTQRATTASQSAASSLSRRPIDAVERVTARKRQAGSVPWLRVPHGLTRSRDISHGLVSPRAPPRRREACGEQQRACAILRYAPQALGASRACSFDASTIVVGQDHRATRSPRTASVAQDSAALSRAMRRLRADQRCARTRRPGA